MAEGNAINIPFCKSTQLITESVLCSGSWGDRGGYWKEEGYKREFGSCSL